MSDTRVALLIGCSECEDPEYPHLPTPLQDVAALKGVLADPSIGDFTVDTVFNRSSAAVSEQIENFFADRKPDDLLLLYFSYHGVLDSKGRLSLVAANTKKELLDSTGTSARWVTEQMDKSRSQRIVLLLDCCYSGAHYFRTGAFVYTGPPLDAGVQLAMKDINDAGGMDRNPDAIVLIGGDHHVDGCNCRHRRSRSTSRKRSTALRKRVRGA